MSESQRVRDARAADHAELQAAIARVVRTPEDVAAYEIAMFETETGLTARPEDWAEALRLASGDREIE